MSKSFLSEPALSWDAMLNIKKGELELISNVNMYLFFRKVLEEEFLTFLRDIVKPTISI